MKKKFRFRCIPLSSENFAKFLEKVTRNKGVKDKKS